MKITRLRATPVAFPDPPLRNSWGCHEPFALRTILQLTTDEGLAGLGEMAGGANSAQALEAVRDVVVGADPWHLERLRAQITSPGVYQAVEIACLDLIGKATGRPVCDLLGGKLRDPVEFSAYLFYKFDCEDWGEVLTPEAMLGEAKRFIREHGFKALKVKGGVLPPDEEIETLRLMHRELGPEYRLRLDPNGVWTVPTSIRVTRALEGVLEYMEDPTKGMEGMAEVARNVNTPLSTNAVVTRFDHIPTAVEMHAVDVVLSDHHYWGGLAASKQLAKICEVFGLGLSMHSNSHLGISLAAMVHLAAATPHLTYACDTHYPWIKEDVIVGENWPFENGCLKVPTAPGLGVELDEAKFARMAEEYVRCGISRRDDAGYMRKKYIPDWEPVSPRW
jgi:glucarate dehydratase